MNFDKSNSRGYFHLLKYIKKTTKKGIFKHQIIWKEINYIIILKQTQKRYIWMMVLISQIVFM